MRASDIPNLITAGRILLVPPIAWALVQQHFLLALVLFFIAGVSDAADGFLAKYYGWTSRLGALLDPLADKSLLVTSYAALAWIGLLPLWLLVLVVVRDVVIVSGAVVYNFHVERLEADPTVIYGMGDIFQGDIRSSDLRRDTPYNTYTRHGLPPTPIALPGRAALEAAAHPEPGDTLYFVADGNGGHTFSRTLEEHQAAVDRLLNRKP